MPLGRIESALGFPVIQRQIEGFFQRRIGNDVNPCNIIRVNPILSQRHQGADALSAADDAVAVLIDGDGGCEPEAVAGGPSRECVGMFPDGCLQTAQMVVGDEARVVIAWGEL